ncbi:MULTISPECIES: S-Ena type endospore appendage [Legionella]|uniref:Endospore appendages core domain-containing protein n=1 Tax=Legionella septentrionalis TaxID=2498109 RepID=A0A3S0XTB7_9GAMM|nr:MULTISPECIES: S-Ena type endospore appendage [Legionella]MCP0912855.1 hypothetical protein [Legionella sp. 27cVA30]RUQ88372.1 hypothetical protein EKM59_05760 [Legionella septentrionalis]RUQ93512.1 hypothetical protein ELY11_11705 [Legionella septentrionalis]RUR09478.1 hypothetical protein ELY14_08510 [Legionella septentrionalis]RUR13255.1 hypothetical protein ELY10_10740 [Legionella septentrionalis]
MRKMFNALLLVLIGFMSAQAYAQKVIKLAPKESRSLTNHYAWTLNATCNIQGSESKGKIRVSILSNKGKINGQHLSQGQARSLTVKNNDNISVSAEPGTKVHLINLGKTPVQAICSA